MNGNAYPRKASQIGSYECVRSLGHGGMAEVFLARASGPQGFEKLVVLKKILPHLADTPRYVRLFLDEAKLAASLDHPNIAQVHHIGMVEGNYCFVMEYVHGRDLRAVLRSTAEAKRGFPIEHAVHVARDIASALHHAHERCTTDGAPLQIVHRDVSPSNIQISYEGAVKLLDFGIAKARTSTMQTRTGARKGKAGYVSPEQARSLPVDRRSDVFALGIVLWEMVTGQRLYDPHDDVRAWEQIQTKVPTPPSRLRADCPPELDAIILRALAREPDQRQQTARELQVELEELAREHRLNLSSVAFSEYMHGLFGRDARTPELGDFQTPTVTDLIAEATPPEDDEDLNEQSTRSLSTEELRRLVSQSVRRSALALPTVAFDDSTTLAGAPMCVLPSKAPAPAAPLEEEPTRRGILDPATVRTATPAAASDSQVVTHVRRTARIRAALPARWIYLIALGTIMVALVAVLAVRRLTRGDVTRGLRTATLPAVAESATRSPATPRVKEAPRPAHGHVRR